MFLSLIIIMEYEFLEALLYDTALHLLSSEMKYGTWLM